MAQVIRLYDHEHRMRPPQRRPVPATVIVLVHWADVPPRSRHEIMQERRAHARLRERLGKRGRAA